MEPGKLIKSNSLFYKLQRFFSLTRETSFDQKNTLFESIFEYALNAYFIYSKETLEVIKINKMATKLFELPPEKDLKGLYMTQVMMRYLAGDSPNLDFLMNSISERWKGEAVFITHNKKRFYGLVSTNILPPEMNENEYQVLSIVDITPIKQANEEVKRAAIKVERAASSKARFLSSMSHELRTPLNGIIGASNVILSDPDLKEEIKNHINMVHYSSEHMLGIVNDILDFSKIDAQKMELKEQAFNLLNCLNNVISSFSLQFKNQDIDLISNFPTEDFQNIEIVSDQTKFSQILKNLLSNALKFTHSGKVELSVKIKESSETGIVAYFEVKDTGIGIPKEKQEEIFLAFSQVHADDLKRKYEGTGLGLTISKQLVNMMGGTLEVDSEMNEGARFYFTLQLKMAEKPVLKKLEDDHLPVVKKDIRGVRVLVVEDNEINANILKTFLQKWQLPIKVAVTGIHALELIKYHKFDLILMDLEMPEMNGYTTLKKIREKKITIPVIAFTATLLDDMDSLITEAGFTDYVLKPFRPSDLKKKIEKYCERKVDYA
ncbi:MAG TPA: ATP-binding protein [Hanamia sp.]|nr:ATP-binding protein [Hanamia sp.]